MLYRANLYISATGFQLDSKVLQTDSIKKGMKFFVFVSVY